MLFLYFLFNLHDTWHSLWEKFVPRSNIILLQSFQCQTFENENIIFFSISYSWKNKTVKVEMQDTMLITSWGAAARTVERGERTLSLPASRCEPLADCSRLCYQQWSRKGGGLDAGEEKENTDLLFSL